AAQRLRLEAAQRTLFASPIRIDRVTTQHLAYRISFDAHGVPVIQELNRLQPDPINTQELNRLPLMLQKRLRNAQEPSINAQNNTCSICLEVLGDQCVVTQCYLRTNALVGRHGFHSDCLAQAFSAANNTTCPNCRSAYCVELAPLAPQYIPGYGH
ncbi:MAG: RING finger protein, partial [Candidatus Babeliales bacterium]